MTATNGLLPSMPGVHWPRTAAPAPKCLTLQGDVSADVVVVGGGLTGTRTALGLAEAGMSVVLLEGRTIGFGASGRSGGQCNPMWRATPDDLAKRLGEGCAARLVETTLTSADDLFADIAKYEIECDAEQNGWVQAAHCGSAQRDMERLASGWQAVGARIDVQGDAATKRATGSPEYGFSLFHKTGGHVHPLSMTRGFAKAAQGFGAAFYENAPVVAMIKTGAHWRVSTPTGSVTTKQVILTTNAYTDNLWPGLRQTIYPMVSVSLATAPLSAEQQASVLPNRVTISDSRRAILYSRYDRENRLVFGCIGSTDNARTLGGVSRLKKGLRKVFPQLADLGIETAWAGRIAVTPEMMPHLHEPDSGVLAGLGFSGRGIAMTSVMARTLVRRALGEDTSTLPFPVLPVEPIKFHALQSALLPLAAPAASLRDDLDALFRRK